MKKLFLLLMMAMFVITACKHDEKAEEPAHHAKEEVKHEGVMVTNPWIRPAAAKMNTAAFMVVMNHTEVDDTLYMAESDLAEVVEVHESFTDEEGRMGMREIKGLTIPKDEAIKLKPRGYHVMLIGVKNDLKAGDMGTVTLHFKQAGKLVVEAEVADKMPMGDDHSHH